MTIHLERAFTKIMDAVDGDMVERGLTLQVGFPGHADLLIQHRIGDPNYIDIDQGKLRKLFGFPLVIDGAVPDNTILIQVDGRFVAEVKFDQPKGETK